MSQPTQNGGKPLVRDGHINLEGGVNSGVPPTLVGQNQVSFAVNTTFRGGFAANRPGMIKIPLDLSGTDDFTGNIFRGGGIYEPDADTAFMLIAVSGQIYKVTVDGQCTNVSIPGDPNPATLPQNWFCQAEKWMIVQDGQTAPLIFDGASSRRSITTGEIPEVPVGGPTCYGLNRVWVSQGRQYVAGDLAGDPSGTAQEGYRDAVLKFSENTFLNGGGAFSLPTNAGLITAMGVTAAPNTALGQSNIIIATSKVICSTSVPTDRTQWQNTTTPLQTIVQTAYGIVGQDQQCQINSDNWYRRPDGYSSLVLAVRNMNAGFGNRPMSREMNRILPYDDDELLAYGSMVNFDNRMLATLSPFQTPNGVAHRGLAVLDFDIISSIQGVKGSDFYSGFSILTQPAWEGVWTGVNILKILTGDFDGVYRCFAFVSSAAGKIELWEITKANNFDSPDGVIDAPIDWWYETRSMICGDAFGYKALMTAELTYDSLLGNVAFDMKFRPDIYPFWQDWAQWSECVTYKDCPPPCNPVIYASQYRPKHGLPEPPDTMVPAISRPMKFGYEFQTRLEVTGRARIKQFRITCRDVAENLRGDLPNTIPCSGLSGCDESIFSYAIES